MEVKYKKDHSYRLIEESKIETNGSTIYRAQDLELGRDVCVKIVDIEGENSREIEKKLERAMLEVRAMVDISEKTIYIPSIFSTFFNKRESKLYIVMKWIPGDNLEKRMDETDKRFLGWMIDLCNILSAMEKTKIYHKDIKPENIMIDSKNELFLIDFNISVSSPNIIEGTPHYKAPEMDMGTRYMGRDKVDIFSIGVILYQYYAGEVPKRGQDYARKSRLGKFQWDLFIEAIEKNPETPEEVNNIIKKSMRLDPKERYANINELKRELIRAERSLKSGRRRKDDHKNFF